MSIMLFYDFEIYSIKKKFYPKEVSIDVRCSGFY